MLELSLPCAQDVALVSITLHNMWGCSAIALSAYLAAVEPRLRELLAKGTSANDIFLFGKLEKSGGINWLAEPTPDSIQRSLAAGVEAAFEGKVGSKTFHGCRGGMYAR
jgi:hypothetical protein